METSIEIEIGLSDDFPNHGDLSGMIHIVFYNIGRDHLLSQIGKLQFVKVDGQIPGNLNTTAIGMKALWLQSKNLIHLDELSLSRPMYCSGQAHVHQFSFSCFNLSAMGCSQSKDTMYFIFFGQRINIQFSKHRHVTWKAASRICNSLKGSLPVIQNQAEMQYIYNLFKHSSAFHPFTFLFLGLIKSHKVCVGL